MSGPIHKNGRMSVSTKKLLNPSEYRQKIESVRVPKNCRSNSKIFLNQCEYRNIVESRLVTAKAGIRASTKKLSGPVRKNGRISVSTEKLLNPFKYRKTVRTSSKKWRNQCEYRKIVESGRLPAKDGIRASTEKLSEQFEKIFESV